ncbi:MAG: riboflavin synthase [Chitinophagales bacterium]
MFTGIIEDLGRVEETTRELSNIHFWISSAISDELKIDQSVAHDGVCLTVVELRPGAHRVTAIAETLSKTNLQQWVVGQSVNMERCMKADGRFDGHIVQGHVDQAGKCVDRSDQQGSTVFTFEYHPGESQMVVEKGSITVNGVSLTAFNCHEQFFSVAIIPYTAAHTNIGGLLPGQMVNLEFDIIGKYVARMLDARSRS